MQCNFIVTGDLDAARSVALIVHLVNSFVFLRFVHFSSNRDLNRNAAFEQSTVHCLLKYMNYSKEVIQIIKCHEKRDLRDARLVKIQTCMRSHLTHICLMDFSILIKWTSISSFMVSGVLFHFCFIFCRNSSYQTV